MKENISSSGCLHEKDDISFICLQEQTNEEGFEIVSELSETIAKLFRIEVGFVALRNLTLKYVKKFCALNFQIVAMFRPCNWVSLFKYRFKALRKWNLILEVS